jgi:predicted RNA-binding protein YlxR (DUF448 family)
MPIKPPHIPIRTCVACRATGQKRGLLRVVRPPEGDVRFDAKGKLSGRGAYVCASPECIRLARKQRKLERSLKVGAVPDSLFEELMSLAAAQGPSPSSGTPAVSGSAGERSGSAPRTADAIEGER